MPTQAEIDAYFARGGKIKVVKTGARGECVKKTGPQPRRTTWDYDTPAPQKTERERYGRIAEPGYRWGRGYDW